jgi:hypothetical protein
MFRSIFVTSRTAAFKLPMSLFRISVSWIAPVALSAAVFACTTTTTKASGDPPVAMEQDAGTDAEPTENAACDPPTIAFAKSPVEIDPPRDHHVTFVHEIGGEPYLYVLGGEQSNFDVVLDDVQRAKIAADGSLGAFETVGKIPMGRAGAALAVVGEDVVLAGGVVQQPTFTDEILVARFDANGHLDDWKQGPKLPSNVQHASAVTVGRDVYVFGGTLGSKASTISVKTTVSAEGELSPLVSLTKLNPPRSHQVAFVEKEAIYLVGGIDKGPIGDPPSRKDAVRATIQADGTLSDWETVGALSSPLTVSSVQKVGCSFLFLGGLDDGIKDEVGPYSDRILRGSLAADGTFRTEEPLAEKLSYRRGHVHQTPVYKTFVYSVGGKGNDYNALGSIDIGTIANTN